MSELKRTVLYGEHTAAGATMVDFGGWDMPIQYPTGIIAEHLFCRKHCAIFDVSHMGRYEITGPDRLAFVQYVLTGNAAALEVGRSQYTILSDEAGHAIDDAYLYRFEEDKFWLVVNAGNRDKDWAYLTEKVSAFDAVLTDVSDQYASIAVQGPESPALLGGMTGGAVLLPDDRKNSVNTLELDGKWARIARTGYTGEPRGYEVFMKTEDAVYFWRRFIELGAMPAALGARDTLRMEAGLPLYGHEMGECRLGGEIDIFAVPAAKFGISLKEEKGDFIGREALEKQNRGLEMIKAGDAEGEKLLPYKIFNVCLTGRGVLRSGCEVFDAESGEALGYMTSGTMMPYYVPTETAEGLRFSEETGKRSLGLAYLKSSVKTGQKLLVDIRGKKVEAQTVGSNIRRDTDPWCMPKFI